MTKTNKIAKKNKIPGKFGSPSAEKNLAIVETVGQKMKRVNAVWIFSISHPENTPFEMGSAISNLFRRSGDTWKHLKHV